MSADSGVSSSETISSAAASAAASAASAAASGISFSSSGVSEPKPIIDIDLGDMYWVLIVAVVVLLFALVRFLGSAFGGKRQSSSKVVCSLGYIPTQHAYCLSRLLHL